jgi:spermidine synthase
MTRQSRTTEQNASSRIVAPTEPPIGSTERRRPSNLALEQLVFWAGAVLMGLEIAGSRVLAPHFGNSVFVWGSLISVFLLALSAGYYWGGWLADRNPSQYLLSTICLTVSLMIFAIAGIASPVCDWLVSQGLGEQSGPLVAGTILFLPPSIGMGMVSPFAVRLATHSVQNVGKIAGTLYALSTMGSIAGTLLTTFVLIPLFGLSVIIKGLAATLLLTSLLALPWRRPSDAVTRVLVFLLIALPGAFVPEPPRTFMRKGDVMVLDVDTPYHHISVIDNRIEDSRQLRFDRFVESAVLRKPPHESLAEYTDYFHLAWLVRPEMERVLFIGAGGGVGPRAFHMHDPALEIEVVDIDPMVIEVARKYFYLEDAPTIHTHADDGRMYVRQSPGGYDCILLDAFTIGGGIPFHLATKEFLELCRERMKERGVFVMNINSAVSGPDARIYHSMQRTCEAVFPRTYAFAMGRQYGDDEQSRNIILVATKGDVPLTPGDWVARAETFDSRSYITRETMRRMVDDLIAEPVELSGGVLFTDEHCPIETMSF